MNIKLTAIINSYNRASLLREAFPSLIEALKNCAHDSAIVVFEAGSDDGSLEYLEEQKKVSDMPIHIIESNSSEDNSFSAGLNRAISKASELYPKLQRVFLFETDNFIKNPDALQYGLELMEQREEFGALGFTVERHDGRKAGFGEKFPTTKSFILGQQLSARLNLLEPESKWKNVGKLTFAYCDIVFTSPLLIDYSVWKEIGGMDQENFPFSDSDLDLCKRIWDSGKKCGVLDINGVIHDNRNIQSEWSESRVLNFHDARMKLLKKHKDINPQFVKCGLLIRHSLETIILILLMIIGKRSIKNVKGRLRLINKLF